MVVRFVISIILLISSCSQAYYLSEERLNLLKNGYGKAMFWGPGVFPLLILVPDSVDDKMYDKLLQEAEYVNLISNCVVFDVVRRSDTDMVFSGFYEYYEYGKVVFKKQEIRINRLAETELFPVSGDLGKMGMIKAAEIRISPVTKFTELGPVIIHELLHALSLGHDLNKNSIMLEAVHASKYQIEKIDLNHIQNICNGLVSVDLDNSF